MPTREFFKAWLPIFLWMALMFCNSTDLLSAEHTSRFLIPFLRWLKPDISAHALAQAQFLLRKAAHVTEYAILAALFFRGWRTARVDLRWRTAAALLPAMLFAAGDEFHQSFVASRTASLGDVLLDCSGALAGILLCRLIHARKAERRFATAEPDWKAPPSP